MYWWIILLSSLVGVLFLINWCICVWGLFLSTINNNHISNIGMYTLSIIGICLFPFTFIMGILIFFIYKPIQIKRKNKFGKVINKWNLMQNDFNFRVINYKFNLETKILFKDKIYLVVVNKFVMGNPSFIDDITKTYFGNELNEDIIADKVILPFYKNEKTIKGWGILLGNKNSFNFNLPIDFKNDSFLILKKNKNDFNIIFDSKKFSFMEE